MCFLGDLEEAFRGALCSIWDDFWLPWGSHWGFFPSFEGGFPEAPKSPQVLIWARFNMFLFIRGFLHRPRLNKIPDSTIARGYAKRESNAILHRLYQQEVHRGI